jgi:hypothetical protein
MFCRAAVLRSDRKEFRLIQIRSLTPRQDLSASSFRSELKVEDKSSRHGVSARCCGSIVLPVSN